MTPRIILNEVDVSTKEILRTFKTGGSWTKVLAFSADGSILVFSDFLDVRLRFYKISSYETLLTEDGGLGLVYKKYIKMLRVNSPLYGYMININKTRKSNIIKFIVLMYIEKSGCFYILPLIKYLNCPILA